MRINVGFTIPDLSSLPGPSRPGFPVPGSDPVVDTRSFNFRVAGSTPVNIKANPQNSGGTFSIKWPNDTIVQYTGNQSSITAPSNTPGIVSINLPDEAGETSYCDEFAILGAAGSGSKNAVTEVISWGNQSWNNLSSSFLDCVNLTTFGTTSLKTDTVANLDFLFKGCTGLTGASLSSWDSTLGFRGREMFADCINISSVAWNGTSGTPKVVKLVQSIAGMFKGIGSNVSGCNFQTNYLDFRTSTVIRTGGAASQGDGMFTDSLINADNSDISNWDFTSSVGINNIVLENTFREARVVGNDKTLNISNWKMICNSALSTNLMFKNLNNELDNTRVDHNLALNMTGWQFGSGTSNFVRTGQMFDDSNFRKIIGLSTWTSGAIQRCENMFDTCLFWAIQSGDNFNDTFWADSAITNGCVNMFNQHGYGLAENLWGNSPNIKFLSKNPSTTTSQNFALMFSQARYNTTLSFESVNFNNFPASTPVTNGVTSSSHIKEIKIKNDGAVSGGVDYSLANIRWAGNTYQNWAFAEVSFMTFGQNNDFSRMTNWAQAFNNSFPDWPLTFATNLNLTNLTSLDLGRTLTPCQADNFIRAVHDTNYLIGAPTPFAFSLASSQVTNSPSVVNTKLLALEAAGYTITDGNPGTTMPFVYTSTMGQGTSQTPTGSPFSGTFSVVSSPNPTGATVNASTGELTAPNTGNVTIRKTLADGCYNEQALSVTLVLPKINNVYSMAFDGTSDFISINNSSETLNVDFISVTTWFYPTSFTNNPSIICTPNVLGSGNHSYNIDTKSNGTLDVILRTGPIFNGGANPTNFDRNFPNAGALNLNQWNFICMTYDGANVKITVNTTSESIAWAPLNGGALDYSTDPGGDVLIGKRSGVNAEIAGNLDELAVFNYALTDEQILAIYNATSVVGGVSKTADLSQLPTPPIKWYRMGD